jgi:hypothetical protein
MDSLNELLKNYKDSVNRFNEVLEKGDGAISIYDLMMGYDAEFYLTGNCALLVNHVIIAKRNLLELYESCGFAYTEEMKKLKETKEMPDKIEVPSFDYSVLFNEPSGAEIPDFVKTADIIVSSYNSQSVYKVESVSGPYKTFHGNTKIITPNHYSIVCTQKYSGQSSFFNNLISVNEQLQPLLKSNKRNCFHVKRQDYLANPNIVEKFRAKEKIVQSDIPKDKVVNKKTKENTIKQEQLSLFG